LPTDQHDRSHLDARPSLLCTLNSARYLPPRRNTTRHAACTVTCTVTGKKRHKTMKVKKAAQPLLTRAPDGTPGMVQHCRRAHRHAGMTPPSPNMPSSSWHARCHAPQAAPPHALNSARLWENQKQDAPALLLLGRAQTQSPASTPLEHRPQPHLLLSSSILACCTSRHKLLRSSFST